MGGAVGGGSGGGAVEDVFGEVEGGAGEPHGEGVHADVGVDDLDGSERVCEMVGGMGMLFGGIEGGVGVRYLGVGTLMNDADVFPAIFPEFDAVVYGPGIEIVEGL